MFKKGDKVICFTTPDMQGRPKYWPNGGDAAKNTVVHTKEVMTFENVRASTINDFPVVLCRRTDGDPYTFYADSIRKPSQKMTVVICNQR